MAQRAHHLKRRDSRRLRHWYGPASRRCPRRSPPKARVRGAASSNSSAPTFATATPRWPCACDKAVLRLVRGWASRARRHDRAPSTIAASDSAMHTRSGLDTLGRLRSTMLPEQDASTRLTILVRDFRCKAGWSARRRIDPGAPRSRFSKRRNRDRCLDARPAPDCWPSQLPACMKRSHWPKRPTCFVPRSNRH